ncbi:tRNA (adenosine(37)-N6)-threonylcarbamoyltransferase complex dimerization subunit type 1 TsaB [Mesonia maritima]|uniref:tRNA threonylcarbamoyladenosine biosynthesis protein TsaB n=1 Tax=Mesonia maritima TaxID=1793873 RepID=A0ABU1K4K6_9FLAO|nr:tRNA (adenosine(37)-N6)-threonylcarbamoyltransferase complex dimerization subunit type 1 TsaB [Mesonia maritima]MDR6300190.1 tRNA threonylcarbamoyladenosine biosynthesis protein TsaB [Mesonia maritima]
MNIILCLETTTTNCSVALSKNGELLALKEDNTPGYSHAEKLHVFINEILREENIEIHELSAVAVSKGPGSYTGLRIGVSAAKGLAFSLGIPLLSTSTLQSLALQAKPSKDEIVLSMLDARRMEAFTAIFDENNQQLVSTAATILSENSFEDIFSNKKVICIGNAVKKFEEILPSAKKATIKFIEANPSAKEMVKLAFDKYKISDTEDVAYFEPYYLKDFLVTKK